MGCDGLLGVLEIRKESDLFVGLIEFRIDLSQLLPQLQNSLGIGIDVEDRTISNARRTSSIGQCRQILLKESVVGSQAGDHEAVCIAPDRLL